MPLSGRYRAVVFDMDGLLLDTETLWHETEIELFRRHGDEFTWDDKLAVIRSSSCGGCARCRHASDWAWHRIPRVDWWRPRSRPRASATCSTRSSPPTTWPTRNRRRTSTSRPVA